MDRIPLRRLVYAGCFVFLALNVRPLLLANPSRSCDTPQAFQAFQMKQDPQRLPAVARSAGSLPRIPRYTATVRNGCIDDARDAFGATGTRILFAAVLVSGAALILGWRPGLPSRRRKTAPAAS